MSNVAEIEAGRRSSRLAPAKELTLAADRARVEIQRRRRREAMFKSISFADPAWDILLDLFVAEFDGRQVSISDACVAAAVSTATALRYLKQLEERGQIRRRTDPEDARRSWLSLAPEARRRLLTLFLET